MRVQSPPIWQRLLAAAAYLLPWSDGLGFGRSLFGLFPALQWLSLPALPVAFLQQAVPFGGFLLFLVLFLAVVRNPRVPYLIRFNVLQAILIDILLVLVDHDQFKAVPLAERAGKLVYDTRGIWRDQPQPAVPGLTPWAEPLRQAG